MRRYAVLQYPISASSFAAAFAGETADAYRIIRTDDGLLWSNHLNLSSTDRDEVEGLVRLLNADAEAIAFRDQIEGA